MKADNADWSSGGQVTLPIMEAAPPPPKPAPPQSPAAAPAPATPPPDVAVHRMTAWGADGSNSIVQRVAGAVGYGPGGAGQNGGAQGQNEAGGTPGEAQAGAAQSDYANRLTPSAIPRDGDASVYADISLLLPETKSFGCLPNSPIDTQLVGGVSCTVDENVWSADGSTILIDKYATVSGEIQRATLNSPATDELGQMGVPGELDEHLWQKIKATAILTAVEGLGNAATALAEKGNGNSYVNFNNGQSLASQALQHDINIPTTLWRGQAWPLRIYVQHDIQFRRAYGNVLVAGGSK
jgi:type IV secretion system protein VirB10